MMKNKVNLLMSHQGFKKYFLNTSWLFTEKILRMVVGIFVGVWVARYLGPEQFGLFSYAQSFVGLFTCIAALGLDSIVIRELVKDQSKRDILLGTAFYLKLVGAMIVLFILMVAISYTSNDDYTNVILFIIASATIFQSFNVIDLHFQSIVSSKYVVYANVISLSVSSFIKIGLILNNAPLIAFAGVIAFDSFILTLGFIYFYYYNGFTIRIWRFESNTAKYLLKNSWPLILNAVVVSVYMKIDQVMIKEMLDTASVGQYAAAVKISEAWYFIPVIICGSLFPSIIHVKQTNASLYCERFQKLYTLMIWLSIVIALPITLLSDWIVETLYGNQYSQAASVLVMHIWASVFVFLGIASGKWFIAENLQMLAFWRTFYGMLINVVLNIYLIPEHGVQGAAMATLISYFFAGFLFDYFVKKTRFMFFMKIFALDFRRMF